MIGCRTLGFVCVQLLNQYQMRFLNLLNWHQLLKLINCIEDDFVPLLKFIYFYVNVTKILSSGWVLPIQLIIAQISMLHQSFLFVVIFSNPQMMRGVSKFDFIATMLNLQCWTGLKWGLSLFIKYFRCVNLSWGLNNCM